MSEIITAETDLPCDDVQVTASFFVDELGFKLNTIFPADDPAVAAISGFGMRLRLVRGLEKDPGSIRLLGDDDREPITAPNGTRVEFAPLDPWPEIPDAVESIHYRPSPQNVNWGHGRAGMQYRDLIPDRWGGRFIASHIRIPDGGPVPDYVHFHKVRFQMIFCYKGWVRLVYEDQGDPFIMKAGECVLQPPEIRHRVLEASDGLEVVELGCPAEHPTHVDHILPLPTGNLLPDRDYNGQRFVFHQLDKAIWEGWTSPGFEMRDLGIEAATDGLAKVRVVRRTEGAAAPVTPDGEFYFLFGLSGGAEIALDGHDPVILGPGASLTVPAGTAWTCQGDGPVEFLEVAV